MGTLAEGGPSGPSPVARLASPPLLAPSLFLIYISDLSHAVVPFSVSTYVKTSLQMLAEINKTTGMMNSSDNTEV